MDPRPPRATRPDTLFPYTTLFRSTGRLPANHAERRRPPVAVADPERAPDKATGVLVLADGSVIWGHGLGAEGQAVGEVCFNTALTGYQEVMTDPSYAGARKRVGGGKECVSTCRSRWSTYHKKKKTNK